LAGAGNRGGIFKVAAVPKKQQQEAAAPSTPEMTEQEKMTKKEEYEKKRLELSMRPDERPRHMMGKQRVVGQRARGPWIKGQQPQVSLESEPSAFAAISKSDDSRQSANPRSGQMKSHGNDG